MNVFRKLAARKIRQNGGYSRGRGERWPLEFCVSLWKADTGFDHILSLAQSDHSADPQGLCIESLRRWWDQNEPWDWARNTMCESLNIDDGRRCFSPETAARYGLDYFSPYPLKFKRRTDETVYYPAKLPGWIRVDPYRCEYFECEFDLAGRGGKHLVVNSFDGIDLQGWSSNDLADALESETEADGREFSNRWCRNLCAMIDEWTSMFTVENASRELEYQCSFYLADEINFRQDRRRRRLKEAEEVLYWNQRDVVTV